MKKIELNPFSALGYAALVLISLILIFSLVIGVIVYVALKMTGAA